MQWTGDRGAGFSTAPRPAMRRPPIDTGPFGYRRVNVERQRERPNSMLSWMERLFRTRREWPEFGWGDWRLLRTGDDAVIALTAEWDGGQVLAVHNLSSRRASARLSIAGGVERGRWHHLLGQRTRNRLLPDDGAFTLDLSPYGYHWFGRRKGP